MDEDYKLMGDSYFPDIPQDTARVARVLPPGFMPDGLRRCLARFNGMMIRCFFLNTMDIESPLEPDEMFAPEESDSAPEPDGMFAPEASDRADALDGGNKKRKKTRRGRRGKRTRRRSRRIQKKRR